MTGGRPRKGSKLASKAWLRAIPPSTSHGSGITQKRLWRVVSDLVRIRDWYKYKTCVATGVPIARWQDGQAGHYISYSVCRGMYKFFEGNIYLQSASSNGWGGMEIGHAFGEELKRRGIDTDVLRKDNFQTELKITEEMVIEKIEDILEKMKDLPEKPSYFDRVMKLKSLSPTE